MMGLNQINIFLKAHNIFKVNFCLVYKGEIY